MKQYPRIFSVSTVGIIYHNNSDYLIHPLRTDFTGGSGSGKSVVADLMQLIFIAKKEYWESATEVMTNEKRTIEGMVLKRGDAGSVGYAFANIEIADKQFVGLGVCIQTNSKSIYPFILQRNGELNNWDLDKPHNLSPYNKFLTYRDFLQTKGKTQQILPIEKLKELLEEKGYAMKDYFKKTPDYHKVLFNNQVLPLDFSEDDKKLKSYSQILQSFSRGKGVGAKSEELKNFLFANEDDLNKEYEKRKKEIEKAHADYLNNSKVYERVKYKREKLIALLDEKRKKEKAASYALLVDTAYHFQQKDKVQRELINHQKDLAYVTLQQIMIDAKLSEINNQEVERDIESLKNDIKQLNKEIDKLSLQIDFAERNQESLEMSAVIAKRSYDEVAPVYLRIAEIEQLVNDYGTPQLLKEKYYKQKQLLTDKDKLQKFVNYLDEHKVRTSFEDSHWFTNYKVAKDNSREALAELHQKIEKLNGLKPLFDNSFKDSFAQWAVKKATKLNKEEEALLMHFKHLGVSKPSSATSSTRFIPTPENVFDIVKNNIVEKNKTGFWINLNGVYEYVEYVEKQLFDNPKTIATELQKVGENIESELTELTTQLTKLESLQSALYEYGYNQSLQTLYASREEVNGYIVDDRLESLLESEFENAIKLLSNPNVNLKDQYEQSELRWNESIKNKTVNEQNRTNWSADIIRYNKTVKDIEEIKVPEKERDLKEYTTETKNLDAQLEFWKTDYTGYLRVDEIESNQLKISNDIRNFEKESASLRSFSSALSKLRSEATEGRGVLRNSVNTLTMRLPEIDDKYQQSLKTYELVVGEFDANKLNVPIDEDIVKKAQVEVVTSGEAYRKLYDNVVNDTKLDIDDERLKGNHMHDFKTLAEVLLPNVIHGEEKEIEQQLADDIDQYLLSINQKMSELNDHKLLIINGIFTRIEEIYNEYKDKIFDLRDFFRVNKISGGHYVELNFDPSKNYPIHWINNLRKKISAKAMDMGLFKMMEGSDDGADTIILKAFMENSEVKNLKPDIKKLTNPKSYFDLSISLKTPRGEDAPGSNGQNYTMLALLCIARLSIIDTSRHDKEKVTKKGIRFMAIDEVAGLGENFDMLYDVARNYDYQILTMTIDPIGRFEEGKQHIYTLRKNNNPEFYNVNPTPLAQFSQFEITEKLGDYIQTLADSYVEA
jgi:DNA repair protein SbcC/Rad50